MSTGTPSSVDDAVSAIEQALRRTREECGDWEREVTELFDELDAFFERGVELPAHAPPTDHRIAADVADLRSLIEQQTDVLTALVNVLTTPSESCEEAEEALDSNDSESPHDDADFGARDDGFDDRGEETEEEEETELETDELVGSVLEQFERLRAEARRER